MSSTSTSASTPPWLRKATCDSGLTYYTAAFQYAITEVRNVVKKQVEVGLSPAASGIREMRERLGLDDDDEKGERAKGDAAKGDAPGSGKKNRPRGRHRPAHVEVNLDGVTLEVKPFLRPLLVRATPESVMAVVKFVARHVKANVSMLKKKDQDYQGSRAGFVQPDDGCPAHTGRVTWAASLLSWVVHWKDSRGKDGLVVRFSAKRGADPAGTQTAKGPGFLEQLAEASDKERAHKNFAANKRAAYIKAIKAWNDMDKSKRDRIPVPE